MSRPPRKNIFLIMFPALGIFLSSGYCNQPVKDVCIKNVCVQAEIADTGPKQMRGLMHRKSLPLKSGMLFIFEQEAKYSFWMKNTIIPLDMIWIDADKRIVDITKNALPCKEEICGNFSPRSEAKYVLEVNSGFSDRFGLNIGDEVKF